MLETPTAAVILEPLLQGAGGMAMVRPEFLRQVEARTRQAGALLIAVRHAAMRLGTCPTGSKALG